MRKRTFLPVLLLAAGLAQAASPPPAEMANGWILGRIAAFRARAVAWAEAMSPGRPFLGPARLKAELDTLRRAYKAFEPAAETLQPQCVELLNGAPIPRLDEDETFTLEIESPQGLQVLEEEVWSARPDRARIALLLAQIAGAADQLTDLLRAAPADDARLWEAAENGVIRVLAMGLTGFDTPASGRGLIESGAALHALSDFVFHYREPLEARSRGASTALDARLRYAARALEMAGDFDAFDRLDFLRRHGNPLHAAMVSARQALGLARAGSIPGTTRADRLHPIPERAVSPGARGLFDAGFLDASFYAVDYDGNRKLPASAAAADLGRRLFFDPVLSGDNRRACASCHRPERAYSDPSARSAGFRMPGPGPHPGGERNAPSLVYAAFQTAQFWDLRVPLLEDQIGHVVADRKEFNTTFASIEAKIRALPGYAWAFARAFPQAGPEAIGEATIASALAQYVRSLAGWNSPFDRYARSESDTLDPAAVRGFNLFMGKAACATCHFPPAFNGTVPPLYRETEAEVLGVPAGPDTLRPALDPDPGRRRVRPTHLWTGAFKTPTVRNAALTAPYMHNGAFPDLEGVVRFYDRGGGAGMGLKVPNQTLPADSLGLSEGERRDLVAFMESLTDDPLKAHGPGILPQAPGRPDLAARPPGGEY